MALMVHELATNAAKYGALSQPAGKLSIQWSLADRTLNLEWRETDGPLVASPAHRGFGLQLLSRALEQFSGAVEMTFETSGLICRMKAMLSESKPSIVPDDQRNSAGLGTAQADAPPPVHLRRGAKLPTQSDRS
jgi:two-component sensor histidine kinase